MKAKKLIIAITIILSLLAVANVVASNTVATTGEKLQALNTKSHQLEIENQQLSRLISQNRSLVVIAEKAAKLGLVPISTTLNLSADEPLARNVVTP